MHFKFLSYHPYLSYSGKSNNFIGPDGRPSFHGNEMSADAKNLWRLGKQAFDVLAQDGEINSREKFDELYKFHNETIRQMRFALSERILANPESIIFKNADGEITPPDLDDYPDSAFIDLIWQFGRSGQNDCSFLGGMFLFSCLTEIDHAIIGMHLDDDAVSAAIAAAEAYANFQAIESGIDSLQKARSDLAARIAIERYKCDPKQIAKRFIKDCWDEWQKARSRYRTQHEFAIDVLTKIDTDKEGNPIISYNTIVKKWIPDWGKGR